MKDLRRRIFGLNTPDSTPPDSRDGSPAPSSNEVGGDDKHIPVKVVPTKSLNTLKHKSRTKPGTKRRFAWVFVLGAVLGLVAAAMFTTNTSIDHLVDLAGMKDLNLDSILDVLPAGLIKDVQKFQSREKGAVDYDSFAVGLHARAQGVRAKYPVIMIPGVISTGLESWGTDQRSRQYFRKRLWGSWNMMRALVLDKAGWKRHIMLDKHTGLDPPGVKLRAAQGFDAADFFITGYWIWNKILENLATIGYDPTNAFTAAYDWRLSYLNYEKRDQYFTRLKAHIEVAKATSGLKAVLLSHSMGSQVLFYFFHWVEAEGYGNGGKNWVEDHVEAWINISGCMLGALKDVPAVLSGEMRDTAQLNEFAVYGLEKFLSRAERAEIFRRMPGISSMLPIGGEAVWGNATWAPDDGDNPNITYGNFINFKDVDRSSNRSSKIPDRLSVGEALPFLYSYTEPWYAKLVEDYSQGIAHSRREVERNNRDHGKWMNPLETGLPNAPSLKIFCFYGVGKPTERAYFYKEEFDVYNNRSGVVIDTSVSTPDGSVDRGVVMGEGDGTVNLLSTGYMCNRGWKYPRYNPANISVTVYEMPHEPERFNPRGGPKTADHVDILGRSSLNELILKIAGGKGHDIKDCIVSNIREYADRVKIYPDDDDEIEDLVEPIHETKEESRSLSLYHSWRDWVQGFSWSYFERAYLNLAEMLKRL